MTLYFIHVLLLLPAKQWKMPNTVEYMLLSGIILRSGSQKTKLTYKNVRITEKSELIELIKAEMQG